MHKVSVRWLMASCMVVAVVGIGAIYQYNSTASPSSSPERSDSTVRGDRSITDRNAGTTGASRAADVGSRSAAAQGTPAATSQAPASGAIDQIGTVKPVVSTANAQVASVAAALQTKTHPERLSALIAPPPFDPASFAGNPTAYVNEVQPGRVFQTAAPGEKTPVLRPMSATQVTLRQDMTVILRVVTTPNAPVSFTSFDLGQFGNQLAAQTVVADAHGVASVNFTPGTGTIDDVHILAGSPVASGQVAFDIAVTPAQTADTTAPAASRAGAGI